MCVAGKGQGGNRKYHFLKKGNCLNKVLKTSCSHAEISRPPLTCPLKKGHCKVFVPLFVLYVWKLSGGVTDPLTELGGKCKCECAGTVRKLPQLYS